MKFRHTLAAVATVAVASVAFPAVSVAQQLPALPQLPAYQAPALPLPATFDPAPPVNPDVKQNYVSFGDSLAANPTVLDIMVKRLQTRGYDIPNPNIREGSCPQDRNAFPTRAAYQTGLRLNDYSCGGATAYVPSSPNDAISHTTFTEQVDNALRDGVLNGDTRLVSVSIGVNDVYQPGNDVPANNAYRMQRYQEVVGAQLQRVRAAAPNAKIVMLGLPDQTDGANHTCATNLLGVVSHWYFPIVSFYQDEVRTQQRNASATVNATYLDMVDEINLARGNNGCSADSNRLSAAVFDDAPHNFTFHLTDAGHGYYANRITDVYRAS